MKITREFAPITIVVDTIAEIEILKSLINKGLEVEYYMGRQCRGKRWDTEEERVAKKVLDI